MVELFSALVFDGTEGVWEFALTASHIANKIHASAATA